MKSKKEIIKKLIELHKWGRDTMYAKNMLLWVLGIKQPEGNYSDKKYDKIIDKLRK